MCVCVLLDRTEFPSILELCYETIALWMLVTDLNE